MTEMRYIHKKCWIAFEYVHFLRESMRHINGLDFTSIVWTKDDKPILISESEKNKWELLGLNNTDFPECWEEKNAEEFQEVRP